MKRRTLKESQTALDYFGVSPALTRMVLQNKLGQWSPRQHGNCRKHRPPQGKVRGDKAEEGVWHFLAQLLGLEHAASQLNPLTNTYRTHSVSTRAWPERVGTLPANVGITSSGQKGTIF
jgi:hypothetical protein